jgi:hypothetical protein
LTCRGKGGIIFISGSGPTGLDRGAHLMIYFML